MEVEAREIENISNLHKGRNLTSDDVNVLLIRHIQKEKIYG